MRPGKISRGEPAGGFEWLLPARRETAHVNGSEMANYLVISLLAPAGSRQPWPATSAPTPAKSAPKNSTLQLTPSERRRAEDAADEAGRPTLSDFARELLFRPAAAVVAAKRRNPEAKAIMQALDAAAFELNAIGNNLNQIARHLNATGELRDWSELREALAPFEKGEAQHIAAVTRVLDL